MATVAGQWRTVAARFTEGGQELVEIDERFYVNAGGVADPPVITPITPALNANLDPYAPVSFSIASSVDLSSLVIWAKGGPRSETIYDATAGVGAQPGYPLSIVSGGGTTTVTIRCTDGWPAGTKIYVSTSAGGAFAVNP